MRADLTPSKVAKVLICWIAETWTLRSWLTWPISDSKTQAGVTTLPTGYVANWH